jgi:hypothetical protein
MNSELAHEILSLIKSPDNNLIITGGPGSSQSHAFIFSSRENSKISPKDYIGLEYDISYLLIERIFGNLFGVNILSIRSLLKLKKQSTINEGINTYDKLSFIFYPEIILDNVRSRNIILTRNHPNIQVSDNHEKYMIDIWFDITQVFRKNIKNISK